MQRDYLDEFDTCTSCNGNGWITKTAKESVALLQDRYKKWQLWVFGIIIVILVILLGSLWHYVYSWSNNNQAVGYFFPTSESTWEHLKLIYWPFIIFTIILWILFRRNMNNTLFALSMAILLACASIVVLFYTIEGAFGGSGIALDIIIYIVAVIVAVILFYYIINRKQLPNWTIIIAGVIIITLGVLFIVFSFSHPNVPIFETN
jgi:hypothetical protein